MSTPFPFARLLAGTALALSLVACSGVPVKIATAPVGPDEEVIGPVKGEETGLSWIGFIPHGQNQRCEVAYSTALEGTGATRLVDITIAEDWWWAYFVSGYKFRIEGTAVRRK